MDPTAARCAGYEEILRIEMLDPDAPILVYHAIHSPGRSGNVDPNAAARQFELQMQWLDEHGYRAVSVQELWQADGARVSSGRRLVGLTFDDGYLDFLMLAHPVLRRHRFTATVFLVVDQVGKTSRWQGASNLPLMSWEQVRQLCNEGVAFGSHTLTHPRLLTVPGEQISEELAASKHKLEQELDQEMGFLAYPYGESNEHIREAAAAIGYRAAFGVITGKRGPFNIWRRSAEGSEPASRLPGKLSDLYLRSFQLRRWIREDTAVGRRLRELKRKRPSRGA